MVGALAFGSFAFGQISSGAGLLLPLAADATIRFTTAAATLAGQAILVIVNGAVIPRIRYPKLTIHDVLGSQPNTGSAVFMGTEPTAGQAITIGYRSLLPDDLLFGGQIQHVTRTYESEPTPALTCYPSDLIDHVFAFNRRRPVAAFVDVSVTTIAQSLVSTYAPGFTTAHVQAGLEPARINFDGSETLIDALNRLAQTIGARVKVDYVRDVHLFLTETITPPDDLTLAHPPLNNPPIQFSTDLSQVRTRVYGKGHGDKILTDVLANETILPLDDVSLWPVSGQAIVGLFSDAAQTQIVGYTGVQIGGVGTLIGPGAAPTVAPVLAVVVGAGLGLGIYNYAYTYVTPSGESLPSPLGSITTGVMPAPATAPILGASTLGAGPDPGVHQYAYTDVFPSGETLPSPLASITTNALGPPGAAPTIGTPTAGAGPEAGVHQYAYTDVTATGETLPGPLGSVTIAIEPNPASAPVVAYNGPNSENHGAFRVIGETVGYRYSYGTDPGGFDLIHETLASPEVTTVTTQTTDPLNPANSSVIAVNIPHSPSAAVKWVHVWSRASSVGPTYYYTDGFANSPGAGVQMWHDYGGDHTSGPNPPTSNNTAMNRTVPLSAIAPGPAGTLYRNIYRTPAGSAQLKYFATLSDNVTTVFTDTTPDASLGLNAPTSSAAAVQTVPVSGIAIGPAATTARKLYRTAAGQSQLRLVATIADNATTVYTDTLADAGLGANVPTSSTAAAQQVAISGIGLGPGATTSRKVYRTDVNGSQLKLQQTIANNTATTGATDATADGALGANAPTVDTSALTQPSGQVNAGMTSIIVAGGSGMFAAGGGWAIVGNGTQVIRYTAVTANALIGIPASGPGAITATIAYGSSITTAPALTGVSGLIRGPLKGAAAHIWVQRDDLAAQSALGILERNPDGSTTDGIREYYLSDERRGAPSLIDLCDAELERFARPIIDVTYATFDRKSKAGATVHINLGWGYVGDFILQDVTITIDPAPDLPPRYAVHASSAKFTFADLLQRVLIGA